MQGKRKIIIWVVGAIVGFVAIMALVIGILTLINGGPNTGQPGAAPQPGSEQAAELPPTNAEAETLKTEALAAMNKQEFDQAIEKYTDAKAIYEQESNEMYVSDLELQIDLAVQQKAEVEKIKQQNSTNGLQPTGR